MSSKILKKRTNSESTDQSLAKKQKKEFPIKTESANETKSNGDGKAEVLNSKQRKREKTKNRKLAAIARIKAEGGIPKALWAGRKEKKAAAGVAVKESDDTQNGEDDAKVSKKKLNKNKNKNRTVEEKLKAKQEEREEVKKLRKEKRQQDGQYKPEQITLTADEIRLRITEIKGRGELTKTARRKLAVFIKKLAILEGTAVKNETDKNNEDSEEKGNLSESAKRRLRREKKGLNGNKEDDDSIDDENEPSEKEKPVDIQSFEKKKKQKVAVKKIENKVQEAKLGEQKNNKQIINKQQNSVKTNNKIIKKEIVKAEPSEDEDEDEDEEEDDEDEEEDDNEDEVAEPDNEEEDENGENSDDEEEEEEEEEEDDDDDDEELNSSQQDAEEDDAKVETVKKPVKKVESKVKKEQGQGAKKQSDQDQNSEKKKRYILFVGNIPFEAKQEDLKKHFLTKVGAVSSVRIPTKPGTQVPRGFGYVEVTNDIDYEKGLSLHHTMLNGRRINVEYTLSGSKKVNNRKELVSKNQKLHALRKAGKLAGSQKHDQKRSVRRYKKKEHERQSK